MSVTSASLRAQATARDHPATVPGAYISGLRAAGRIDGIDRKCVDCAWFGFAFLVLWRFLLLSCLIWLLSDAIYLTTVRCSFGSCAALCFLRATMLLNVDRLLLRAFACRPFRWENTMAGYTRPAAATAASSASVKIDEETKAKRVRAEAPRSLRLFYCLWLFSALRCRALSLLWSFGELI